MKISFGFCWFVLMGCITNSAVAYGVRGAAEKALYYMAYLAEENTPGATYQVAPGCTGTDRGPATTRCSLKEFLLYIWKPTQPDDLVQPTGWRKPPKELNGDASQNKIDSLISNIDGARTNLGREITGNCDSDKLYPGHGDYYQILSEIGEPINKMKAAAGNSPNTKQARIIERAKEAATAVVGLRWMDMESYRIGAMRNRLRNILGSKAQIMTSTWRSGYQGDPAQLDADGNPVPNTKGRPFNIIDIPATILANGVESTDDIIQAAQGYATQNQRNINHFTAIESAQRVALSLECALP